jgi:hypothetical protein
MRLARPAQAGDIELDDTFFHIWQLRDGKIVRFDV